MKNNAMLHIKHKKFLTINLKLKETQIVC